jgi:hypothetical protein
MRYLIIFAACFAGGAIIALVVRAIFHEPYAEKTGERSKVETQDPAALPQSGSATPINTMCPVCGMDVDAKIPVQEWRGHHIGLGCATCPPKFAQNPDHYGAYALKNQQAPKP